MIDRHQLAVYQDDQPEKLIGIQSALWPVVSDKILTKNLFSMFDGLLWITKDFTQYYHIIILNWILEKSEWEVNSHAAWERSKN